MQSNERHADLMSVRPCTRLGKRQSNVGRGRVKQAACYFAIGYRENHAFCQTTILSELHLPTLALEAARYRPLSLNRSAVRSRCVMPAAISITGRPARRQALGDIEGCPSYPK